MSIGRSIYKRILNTFLYGLYLVIIVLVLTEIAYRYQVIDFYRTELNALNQENELNSKQEKKTILVCGDSFTVQSGSWADQLRASLPNYRIINSAITGTGIVEASYIAPGRINSFNPDIFIYQIYVGNDLLGVRHSLNWNDWSFARNIYWWMSDRIRVLAYLNYKMGQLGWNFSSINAAATKPEEPGKEKFELTHYVLREKIYAQGDPFLINNSVLLGDSRDEDLDYISSSLKDLISKLRSDCKIYLLVIPHKAQLNTSYLNNMRDIGFQFDESFTPGNEHYPFIEKLKNDFSSNPTVEVLNPFAPLMQKDTETERVYYLNDEHLSRAGQTIVKDLVLNRIK